MQGGAKILVYVLLACVLLCSSACFGGGGPKNVLLVINQNSPVSQRIGASYQEKRGIPERNVLRIYCSTSEHVSQDECENNIVSPVRSFLLYSGVGHRIDYIVLTKGIPLRASYDDTNWWGPVSVESVLTCVGEPDITTPVTNPYGPTASPSAPEQYFTSQLSFDGRSYYVVTRLDAYTEEQVYRMIDDSVVAQPSNGLFVLDGRYESRPWSGYYRANDRLRQANTALFNAGYSTYYDPETFDSMINEFVGGQQGVMGYFSWGSNEGSYTLEAYTSNQFIPGSIADTFVSSSGRTLTYPPTYGQSLIADLIPQGLSGGCGYVSEPSVSLATYPNVLFDRYIKGYNMGESFFAANPRLYWKATVLGDPLMAPYATPPIVETVSPDTSNAIRGVVEISAAATDESGIARVEFYLDDRLVAASTQPPYRVFWNTNQYPDGTYLLEIIAYENTPVFTQGIARAHLRVQNVPLNVPAIGLLDQYSDGEFVRLAGKAVIAGTDAFTDCVYISEIDRSTGIKVTGISNLPTGSLATVSGILVRTDGECMIEAVSATVVGSAAVPPLGMINTHVGNRGSQSGPEYCELADGLSSGSLLVKTWGEVLEAYEHEFLISDGSLDDSPSEPNGVRVALRDLVNQIPVPAAGTYVAVVGVSTYAQDELHKEPVIRPRFAHDITYPPQLMLTSPNGMVAEGWNLISIPGIAANPRPEHVFAGLNLDHNLMYWDPIAQSSRAYDMFWPEEFPVITPGTGFWLNCPEPHTIRVGILGNDEPNVDMWISLPREGFSLVGHPFKRPVNLDLCLISDGVQVLPIGEAVAQGWLHTDFHYYLNSTNSLRSAAPDTSAAYLEPWRGYWVRSHKPNLALIIPY